MTRWFADDALITGTIYNVVTSTGADTTLVSDTFIDAWEIVVEFEVATGTHNEVDGDYLVGVQIASLQADSNWRFNIRHLDSGGAEKATSTFSAQQSAAGAVATTQNMPATSWSAGDDIRLSVWGIRVADHGNRTFGIAVDDADTYIDDQFTPDTGLRLVHAYGRGYADGYGRGYA